MCCSRSVDIHARPLRTQVTCSNLRDAANSVKKLPDFLSNNLLVLPSNQIVLQASSVKDAAFEITELHTTQWAKRVDIHTCETLSSGL